MAMSGGKFTNRRTFRWSAWLGWQLESNWTDPFPFLIYTLFKPIAGSLILVVMYLIIAGIGDTNPDIQLFYYMYVSNAFFMYAGQVLFGVTWIIHDDREHYRTLKYIFISPANFFVYMMGRTVSKLLITTLAVFITLAFGVIALGIPINLLNVNWPVFLLAMILGLACIIAFGLALAGISFLTAKHSMSMNEGVAGVFYLFCGVLFPVSILPSWGIALAKILPVTYWLELVRRTLGVGIGVDSTLADLSLNSGLAILFISTVAFLFFSIGMFKFGDYMARRLGLVDMTTAY